MEKPLVHLKKYFLCAHSLFSSCRTELCGVINFTYCAKRFYVFNSKTLALRDFDMRGAADDGKVVFNFELLLGQVAVGKIACASNVYLFG